MRKPIFTGVCTALVTPFLEGKINYPLARLLLKRQMDAGVKAVVVAGTTGEAPALSDKEKIELFRQCKETAGDDCTIIAGTGSNSTAHTIELSQAAEETGADALLIVSPYYNKPTPDGLFAHYLSVAHSVSIPIILYNVPSRTGIDMPVSVYKRLSRIPNIVGVKEASTDIKKIIKIRNACASDFYIWSGNDELTVPIMAMGGKGVISVSSNVCPEQMVSMAQAAINEDFESASAIQAALQPMMDLMFCETNPIPCKAAMACIGFDCGSCRLPLTNITAENHKKIISYFN